jgi:alkylation response protein AidB-like acyl-CoA dehydrogenase
LVRISNRSNEIGSNVELDRRGPVRQAGIMTQSKIDWVDLTRSLGPQIAEERVRHDLEGSFVEPAYALLAEHRFFSMAVPAELGGGGAGYQESCEVLRELAHHCPSTALAFSMHSHLLAATVWKYRHDKPGEKMLRKVAAEQTVLLSTGASDWVNSNGRMRRVEGGYRVDARKVFGSGGPAADMIVTSSRYESPHEGELVLHFSLPAKTQGLRFDTDWDTLGMRGTGSNTIVLEDVFVPDEAVALTRPSGEWHPAWSVVITVAPPLYMSVYVGLAEAACDKALAAARGRETSPGLTFGAGELRNRLYTARAIWRDMVNNACEYDFAPDLERANRALMAKTLVADACVESVRSAMMLSGGKGFFRGFGLEAMLRDVHAAPYHPLPEKRQLEFTGRQALGLDPVSGARRA